MGTEEKTVLIVNAGSSSLKADLITDKLEVVARTVISLENANATAGEQLARLVQATGVQHLQAIGHRLVHSGPYFKAPTLITNDVLSKLEELAMYDPEHTPRALQLIREIASHFQVPHVACFDTTFFNDLPRVAQLLPLPQKYSSLGLRRYGFHGLSYESLLEQFQKQAGETAAYGRVIMAHLGSGASLAAINQGKAVDTTMSFTPVSGIPMSTRSGDIDPGVMTFLQRQAGLNDSQINHMVHYESGLLGISGTSNDMKHLLDTMSHDAAAADAVELFCYRARQAIGSLSTVLGGVDSLIFAGGIGEQSAIIRSKICEGLDYLGIRIDAARNEQHAFLISDDDSAAGVHVIPSNEARVIARQTLITAGVYHA